MKTMISILTSLIFAAGAQAYVRPVRNDFKPATQVMLQKQAFGAPIVATANYIKTTYAGPTSAAALTLSSFTHQPDVPRNITITPTGTTGDVESCVVTIAGTNIKGTAITDTITFSANASTIGSGTKAFKTVTSVTWPADCESGGFAATWTIGVGELIGLNYCLDAAGNWAWSTYDGAYESTRATVTADADEVEKNVADFNGTMDGVKLFNGYFIENYACR